MTGTEEPKLAVVVHAFYPDIFEHLVEKLDRLPINFKLFVSSPTETVDEIRRILESKTYPKKVYEVENRGRDIAPFLMIASELIDRFPLVLKLHTKKSEHFPKAKQWREDLYDYLTEENQFRRNLYLIDNSPIGMISHPNYIVPIRTSWRPNKARVRELVKRMGQEIRINEDVFIAGSMFLARTEALKTLLNLGLQAEQFEVERKQKDATLAHAIERVFAYSARATGFEILGSTDKEVLTANYRRFGGKIWQLKLKRLFSRLPFIDL